MAVRTDAPWAELGPLVEACRPHAKVPPSDPRRTVEAIIRRRANGAKWRSVPADLGPLGGRSAAPARRDGRSAAPIMVEAGQIFIR